MVGRKLLGAITPDLKDVLSDDYTRIDSQGQLINREQELERLKDTGVSPASYFKIIEKQAQVYGNIGFVKSVLEIDNPYKTDYPSGKYRVLNIYSSATINGCWIPRSGQ